MLHDHRPRLSHLVLALLATVLGAAISRACLGCADSAVPNWRLVGALAYLGAWAFGGVSGYILVWLVIDQRRETRDRANESELARHKLAAEMAKMIAILDSAKLGQLALYLDMLYDGQAAPGYNRDYDNSVGSARPPTIQPEQGRHYDLDGVRVERALVEHWLDRAERNGGKLPAIRDPQQRGRASGARPKLEALTRYLCDLQLAEYTPGPYPARLVVGRDAVQYALEQDRI